LHWGPQWLVWVAEQAKQQYAQHVEHRLRPDHIGASTTVTVGTEADSLIPDYRIKRAGNTIIDAASEGLRQ
jgi:hypothetical protein